MNAVAKTIEHEVEPHLPAVMTPMAMLDRAVANGASIEVLTKLMDLQERYEKNLARRAFDNAMAEAQAELPVILKNREVDFTTAKGRTHYKYEDLASVVRTVDPILAKHGLTKRFRVSSPPNEPVTVTCIVSHRDGYSEENTLSAGRDDSGNKNAIQAIGSALTYLQRMTLKASLGLAASADDDGAASGARPDGDGSVEETSAPADGPLSAEQLATLQQAIVSVGVDIAKVLAYARADRLEAIPARHYEKVLHVVRQYRPKTDARDV